MGKLVKVRKGKLTRREALSTAGKIAIGAVVAGVVAGVGGYFAGSSAAPTKTVTETRTVTAAEKTVTKTVTVTAPTTVTTSATTPTVTSPTTVQTTVRKLPGIPEEVSKVLSYIDWNKPKPMKERLLADEYILPEGWEKAVEGVEEITYINWGAMKHDIATWIAIKNFEKKTGIKVKNWDVPHEYVIAKQLAILTARDPSLNCFYIGDSCYYLKQFITPEWFLPVDFLWPPEVRELYPPSYVESIYYDGHYWGTPHFTGTYVLYYRPSWLKEAGVEKIPDTWPEVFEAAKKCREWAKRNLGPEYYGIVFPDGREVIYDLIAMVYSQGGDLIKNGKVTVLTEEFKNAWLLKLRTIYEDIADKACLTYTWTDAADVFGAGKAAFYMGRTAYIMKYMTEYPEIRGDWDAAPPPKWSLEQPDTYRRALIWGDMLACNKWADPNKIAATLLWMDFRRSKESLMYEVIVEGNESPLTVVYQEADRLIKEVIDWDLVKEAARELGIPEPPIPETLPKADVRSIAVRNGVNVCFPAGVGDTFARALEEFFGKAGTKEIDPIEALEKIQEELDKYQ